MNEHAEPDFQAEDREMIAEYNIPYYASVLDCFSEISAERREQILDDEFDRAARNTAIYLHRSGASHAVDILQAEFRNQIAESQCEEVNECLFCVLNFMELRYRDALNADGFCSALRKLLRCSLNLPAHETPANEKNSHSW